MKIPIPSDWDGESWQCVQVQWPASTEYLNILLGFLSQMARGPFWDINTGWIPDAQEIGREVFDRNYPLVSCDGAIIPDGTPDAQNGTCNAFEELSQEDYAMPCLDLTGLIKIEDGVLYVKDSCCTWIAIGTLEGQEETVAPDVLDDQLPVGQTADACGRAFAVWDTIIQTAHAVWDHHLDAPWQTIGNIRAAAPVNLTLGGIWDAVGQAIITDALWGGDDIFNSTKLQKVLCEMVPHINATTDPFSDSEWDAVKRAFASFGDVTDLFIQNFYSIILAFAITRPRLSNVAQAGALNDEQDCRCPDEVEQTSETTPDANGWYLGVDLSAEVVESSMLGASWHGIQTHDVYGVFMRLAAPPAADPTKRMSASGLHDAHPEIMPVIDGTVFTDTSDHLEVANLAYPLIQLNSQPISVSLTAQRGFSGYVGLIGGVDSPVIASPEWAAGLDFGFYIASYHFLEAGYAPSGLVVELRLVHNTNSPSHA